MNAEPRIAESRPTSRTTTAWAALALVLPIVLVSSMSMGTVDLLYHLRAGAQMLDSRALVRVDAFTFTAAGLPWVDQQWLSQVIYAAIFQRAGGLGLALLRTGLSIAVLSGVFAACRARGAAPARAFWLTLVSSCLLLPTLQLRPQLFGLACFALVVWLLSDRHRHPRAVWGVVPVLALWANLHGTFFLAIGLIGLAWIEDVATDSTGTHGVSPHRLIPIGLLAIAATCVNPFGPAVWSYVVALSSNESVRRLATEWQPTSIDSFSGAAFLVSVPLVVWRLARARTSNTSLASISLRALWPTLLTLASFLLIGLLSVRGVYWWAIVAPVVLAGLPDADASTSASATPPRAQTTFAPTHAMLRLGTLVCALVSVAPLVRWAPYRSPNTPFTPMLSDAPVGITAALQRTLAPGERVFNAQMWGSWFEFTMPTNPVVVDSRIELIPADTWTRYADVANARDGWHDALTAWQIRVVALSAMQQPHLLARMRQDARWRVAYEDQDGAVLVRR